MESRIKPSPPHRLCFRIQVNPSVVGKFRSLTKRGLGSPSVRGLADQFRSLATIIGFVHELQACDEQQSLTNQRRSELYHLHGEQIESCPYIRRLIPKADMDKLRDIQAMFDSGYVPKTIDALSTAFGTHMALTILRAFTTTDEEAS